MLVIQNTEFRIQKLHCTDLRALSPCLILHHCVFKDENSIVLGWWKHGDFQIKASAAANCRINTTNVIGCANDNNALSRNTVQLYKQFVDVTLFR